MISRILTYLFFICVLCVGCDDDEKVEPIQQDFYAFGKLKDKGVYWENAEAKSLDSPGDVYDGVVLGQTSMRSVLRITGLLPIGRMVK
jgi:hypothetical protein